MAGPRTWAPLGFDGTWTNISSDRSFGARSLPYHSPASAPHASKGGEIASPGTGARGGHPALKQAEPPALQEAGRRVLSTMLPFQILLEVQCSTSLHCKPGVCTRGCSGPVRSSPLSGWDFAANPPDFRAPLVLPVLTPSRLPLAHHPVHLTLDKNTHTLQLHPPSRGLSAPLPLGPKSAWKVEGRGLSQSPDLKPTPSGLGL